MLLLVKLDIEIDRDIERPRYAMDKQGQGQGTVRPAETELGRMIVCLIP